MIVCVLLHRFELVIAAGGRAALAQGPMALAPEPGREQHVGEVSQAAEALGIHPGMRLGEALATCPSLALIEPDAAGAEQAWEEIVCALENAGFAVDPASLGVAYFETGSRTPLRRARSGTQARARRRGDGMGCAHRRSGAAVRRTCGSFCRATRAGSRGRR